MPWWFWVLLWAVLSLGSLASAAAAGYWLFRKGFAVVRDAGESLERLVPASRWEPAQTDDDGAPARGGKPGSAVFADPAAIARTYAEGKAGRRDARRSRRIERRAQRGQPQSLRDLGLD